MLSTNSVKSCRQELHSLLEVPLWLDLAARISDYCPHVIILVARKMPRLRDALALHFNSGAIAIADVAIPFCHAILRNARVAIVDDIVNLGTTMSQAEQRVRACGASEVRYFALAKTARNTLDENNLTCARDESISDDELKEIAGRIPQALSLVNKPFDLDFPIIPCLTRVPISGFESLFRWLRAKYGDRVHNLSSRDAITCGLFRFSVDLTDEFGGIKKIRFYLDQPNSEINIVPIAVPPHMDGSIPSSSQFKAIFNALVKPASHAPENTSLWTKEPFVRAELFVRSLGLGLHFLNENSDAIGASCESTFSKSDAAYAFGPIANNILVHIDAACNDPTLFTWPETKSLHFSNRIFSENSDTFAQLAASFKGLGRIGTEFFFASIFERLNKLVGATDPGSYGLSWPFKREEIQRNPYLRLRIGFTFDELVDLIMLVDRDSDRHTAKAIVGDLLDRFIDEGVVVPTIAQYEGELMRVYRKGEHRHRDIVAERILFAHTSYGKPLSRTRLAKILTILTLSEHVDTLLTPMSEARGNVSVFRSELLATEDAEITRFLITSGQLKRAVQRGDGTDAR